MVHRACLRIRSSLNPPIGHGGHTRSSPLLRCRLGTTGEKLARLGISAIGLERETAKRRCFIEERQGGSAQPVSQQIPCYDSSPSHRGRCRWMMSSSTPAGTWPQNSRPASCGVINLHSHTPTKRTISAQAIIQHALLAPGKLLYHRNRKHHGHAPKQRMVCQRGIKVTGKKRQPGTCHATARTWHPGDRANNAADIRYIEQQRRAQEDAQKERARRTQPAAPSGNVIRIRPNYAPIRALYAAAMALVFLMMMFIAKIGPKPHRSTLTICHIKMVVLFSWNCRP